MANHYLKFISNYTQKINPLCNLLKKSMKFNWSVDCQQAFQTIKAEIVSDQVLVHFDSTLPIILSTYASNAAVASILSHKFPDNTTKSIAFVSRALTKAKTIIAR